MNELQKLRRIDAKDFASLGMRDLVYIKRVCVDGASAFAVHAADGTQVALLPSRETAVATLREHDLDPLSLH